MVEYTYDLDSVFSSLSDPTRRDILQRVSEHRMNVGQIAKHYAMSLAGVAKHLEVLERAGHPVGIVTKSALVTRDIDILSRMAKLAGEGATPATLAG